jgi:hypothetical protein
MFDDSSSITAREDLGTKSLAQVPGRGKQRTRPLFVEVHNQQKKVLLKVHVACESLMENLCIQAIIINHGHFLYQHSLG